MKQAGQDRPPAVEFMLVLCKASGYDRSNCDVEKPEFQTESRKQKAESRKQKAERNMLAKLIRVQSSVKKEDLLNASL